MTLRSLLVATGFGMALIASASTTGPALAGPVLQCGAGAACSGPVKITPTGYAYSGYSCYQLWHARNSIYAQRGYCFKTYRARRVFGRRCYPPYGRLTSYQRRVVNAIRRAERRQGC